MLQSLLFAACSLSSLPLSADEEIDRIFAEFDQPGRPGCAVAVVEAGEIVYSGGFGEAQLEFGAPITPDTPFHVASVSKQFAAFAAVLLAQDGKLDLDADIRTYVRDLHDFGTPITTRQLIHHTSGLRDQWQLLQMAGWRMDDVITHDDVMRLVRRQRELNFAPGSRHLYCNTGYTLIAEIIQRITGKSLREFAHERMFEPLDMPSTRFHDDHTEVVPGRAYSYIQEEGQWKKAVLSYAVVGATSLFTTVTDLARWVENFELRDLGGDEAMETMLERGVLTSGHALNYAGGLVHGSYRGVPTVSHSGADAGFRSVLLWFPEHELSIAVLSNSGDCDPAALANQVADVYLVDDLEPVERRPLIDPFAGLARVGSDSSSRSPYAGFYVGPFHDDLFEITLRKGSLGLDQGTQSFPLVARDGLEHSFTVERHARFRQLDIRMNEEGVALGGVLTVDGDEPLTLKPVEPSYSFIPRDFAGRYYSPELDVHYDFVTRPGRLMLRTKRGDDTEVTPRYQDGFEIEDGTKLHFYRDAEDQLAGFFATDGRCKNIRFLRTTSPTLDG